ncbi:Uma2 family endonuclease [Desulfobacterales bacterium HSG17]|nr:Uma2 family endonuclease [Desulfobacterales bacterium HSG17]
MAEMALKTEYYDIPEPDISHIITEDDTPVDNIFSEKQQRLLTESISLSWKPDRPFISLANVGIFYGINLPPIVPDVMVSLDVKYAEDVWKKKHRSYFVWEFGKPPEVVIEVVSNRKGGETDAKMRKYAQVGVWYYIILDPQQLIQKDVVRVFELSPGNYIPKLDLFLPKVNIGVKLWEGNYEGMQAQWLRWCDKDGNLMATGKESVEQEKMKVVQERKRAVQAEKEVKKERDRAKKLEEKLRALGIDPDES